MEGAAKGIVTQPLYLDLMIPEGGKLIHPVPNSHRGFIYAYRGEISVNKPENGVSQVLNEGELGVLGAGDHVELQNNKGPSQLLLLAATPLNEPIARFDPFVMNTQDEILKAVNDYRAGRFD